MAVVSGLAPESRYPDIVKLLDTEYNASPYMEKYVLEALFIMGQPQRAIDRMHKRYAKMLGYKDYTTLFEGWGIGAEGFGGGTLNHAWSGGPLTLMCQKICGVEPTSPGFKTFKISPQLGKLKRASTSIETNYGTISVSLVKKGSRIAADITVPQGTTAQITVKGKPRTLAPGTHHVTI